MSPQAQPSDDQLDAASWCGHLVPDGSVYAFLVGHRHELFPPELFADVVRQGGGHPSVPAEVIATVMVLQALEGLADREVVEQTGVLTGRGRRVLDSTILADAVATQDTVTQLVAAVRRVRRLVGQAREVELTAHDDDRPGKPECAWDDPQAKAGAGVGAGQRRAGPARGGGRPEVGGRAGRGGRAAGAGGRPRRRAGRAARVVADRPAGRP